MEIIIDGFNFWGMEPMKYWSFPKSYDKKRKKEESRAMIFGGNMIGSRKMDGAWNMIIKDMEGNIHVRSRQESVNGGYQDKAEWIPQVCDGLKDVPNGTVFLGEIYIPSDEGSRKVTSVFNCLKDKCLERQKNGKMLHYYIFDVLAFDGKSLINAPIDERVRKYLDVKIHDVINSEFIEFADYKEGEELWELYCNIISSGGEGIVITQKTCKYLCGKRTARVTLKLKKELDDPVDAFIDGNYKTADKLYTGLSPETWDFWFNEKTGEKTRKNKFPEYTRGEAWIPIKKTAYYNWASSISFSVMKDGKPYHIGYISGIPDSMKEEITKEGNSLIGKVYSLNAMMLECINGHYSFRHASINEERPDKRPEDCDFAQIAN